MEKLIIRIEKLFIAILKHKDINNKLYLYKKIKKLVNDGELSTLENIKKEYTFCTCCEMYHKNDNFKYVENIETFTESTYTDAGYGDSDKIGEVTYLMKYAICNKCGQKKLLSKQYIKTENERYARGW